jgi:hypothetical protein
MSAPKRDLAVVIDAMLALVPDGEETRGLRMSLQACKSSVLYTAPEAMAVRWQQCAQMLASHVGVPREPWQRALFGVWNPDAGLPGDITGAGRRVPLALFDAAAAVNAARSTPTMPPLHRALLSAVVGFATPEVDRVVADVIAKHRRPRVRMRLIPPSGVAREVNEPATVASITRLLDGHFQRIAFDGGLVLLVDEDGDAKKLPTNPVATLLAMQTVRGSALALRESGGDFVSLTDEDVTLLSRFVLVDETDGAQ